MGMSEKSKVLFKFFPDQKRTTESCIYQLQGKKCRTLIAICIAVERKMIGEDVFN